MKQEKVVRNIFISLMIGAILAVGIFTTLEWLSSNPVDAKTDKLYTVMVTPVGDKQITHVASSYKVLQNNWLEITENDGRVFTVNVNNSHVIIEEKK